MAQKVAFLYRLTRHTSSGIDPHARREMQRQINRVSGILSAIRPDGDKLIGFRVAVATVASEHLVNACDVQHVACEKPFSQDIFFLRLSRACRGKRYFSGETWV